MGRKRKGAGQPAKGPSGERVSKYPVLLVRIPRATKRQLEALAVLRRQPQWALVDDAIRAFVAQLPDAERERVENSRGRRGLRQFKDSPPAATDS
jgi:hypothetical protein